MLSAIGLAQGLLGCGAYCTAAAYYGSSAIAGAATGAVAGAASTAVMGGNIGQGALAGAALGGIAGIIGTPNFQPFGNSAKSAVSSIGNRLFNTSLTGAGFGAAHAGMTGGSILQGAARGALAWGIGEGANMLIGHGVGFFASGGKGPKFENGAFYYDANTNGWITFGNVVTGPYNVIDKMYTVNGRQYTIR